LAGWCVGNRSRRNPLRFIFWRVFTWSHITTAAAASRCEPALFKLLKSSCHLDHLDTGDVNALRTHIYASILAAVILSALTMAAAKSAHLAPSAISLLAVGNAAPLLAVPLLMLWLGRRVTTDELAAIIMRTLAIGCRDQNPARTRAKWGSLR